MIQNRQNEEHPYISQYQLNAFYYGEEIQYIAEYDFNKHQIEGWLTHSSRDDESFGLTYTEEETEDVYIRSVESATWRKYGDRIIYSGKETRLKQFIRDLYDDLDKRGFTNINIHYKKTREQIMTKKSTLFGYKITSKDDTDHIGNAIGALGEGYMVFVHVEW